MGVELVLAVVAAVGRVGAVLGPLELAGLDDFVPQAEGAGRADREIAVALGVAGAVGGDADGAVPSRRAAVIAR